MIAAFCLGTLQETHKRQLNNQDHVLISSSHFLAVLCHLLTFASTSSN